MNGGLTECHVCDCDPCQCFEIKAQKDRKRDFNAKRAIEAGFDAFGKLKGWRKVAVKWLWPDVQKLANALYDYWDKD